MCFNLYLRHHTPTEHDIEKCPRCEEARIMRRILARWLNLAGVLTFRDVSQCVKDRFPTLDHIKSAGFLTLPVLRCLCQTLVDGSVTYTCRDGLGLTSVPSCFKLLV